MNGVTPLGAAVASAHERCRAGPAGMAAATTMARAVLYVAAKAPRPGLAKTRLGRTIGDEAAVLVYRAFLRDLAARFARAPFPVGWYVTPADAWAKLAPLVACAEWAGPVLVQGPGDWTARQRALFRGAAGRGEDRTVLVASDSPQLPLEVVTEAFALLDRHDLVLGPTSDGGYYLIGMRGWHDVLAGVRMSTGTVLDEILARAAAAGLSTGLVEATFDVDEASDLESLRTAAAERADLGATRAALATLAPPTPVTEPPVTYLPIPKAPLSKPPTLAVTADGASLSSRGALADEPVSGSGAPIREVPA